MASCASLSLSAYDAIIIIIANGRGGDGGDDDDPRVVVLRLVIAGDTAVVVAAAVVLVRPAVVVNPTDGMKPSAAPGNSTAVAPAPTKQPTKTRSDVIHTYVYVINKEAGRVGLVEVFGVMS